MRTLSKWWDGYLGVFTYALFFALVIAFVVWGHFRAPKPRDPIAESVEAAHGRWTSCWGLFELDLVFEYKDGRIVGLVAIHREFSADPPLESRGSWRPTADGVEVYLPEETLSLTRLPKMGTYELMAPSADAPFWKVWFQDTAADD